MLIAGIHLHGFGSWEIIRKDAQFGLQKKIALPPNSTAAAQAPAGAYVVSDPSSSYASSSKDLPGPAQLSTRAEAIFKLLRDATGRKPIGGGGGGGDDEEEGDDEDYDGKEKKKGKKGATVCSWVSNCLTLH